MEKLKQFLEDTKFDLSGWEKVSWIQNDVFDSGLPWLELIFPFNIPYSEMLEEARKLKNKMVSHRNNDGNKWRSISIHGLAADITNNHKNYGWTDETAPYLWTEICQECPVTYHFFKEIFKYDKYYRIRFMLLEAGGYIEPHIDNNIGRMTAINMSLNMPKDCIFRMKGFGDVPFKDGNTFLMNVGNEHALINESSEDRYHIIIHGYPNHTNELWRKIYHDSWHKTKNNHTI